MHITDLRWVCHVSGRHLISHGNLDWLPSWIRPIVGSQSGKESVKFAAFIVILERFYPGLYALRVSGNLPEDAIEALEANGIRYRRRDGTAVD